MKIESGRGVGSTPAARRAGAAAAPGFAPNADAPQRVAASASTSPVTPLDAIMALQAETSPTERRARQARRGRAALDALDEILRGLLLGGAPAQLRTQLLNLRRGAETTGEAGLDAVLLEIDTRVEVELAKLDLAAGSA